MNRVSEKSLSKASKLTKLSKVQEVQEASTIHTVSLVLDSDKMEKDNVERKLSRKGYQLEREIIRGLEYLDKKYGVWYHKWSDTNAYDEIIRIELGFKPELILPKAPADFVMVYEGNTTLLEAKGSIHPRNYNLDLIASHQIEEGIRLRERGRGQSFFLICNRSIRGHHRLYILTPGQIKHLKAKINKNVIRITKGKRIYQKSVKWEVLDNLALYTLEKQNGMWDLTCLLTRRQKYRKI